MSYNMHDAIVSCRLQSYDATIQCPEKEIEGEMDGEGGAHLTLI